MKTKFVVFAALFVVFAASCSKKDDKGQLDPDAMISLRAAKDTRASNNPNHLTPLEIVKQAHTLVFCNKKLYPDLSELSRGFGDYQRDLVNERLLMFGTDIIGQYGTWEPDFIEGEDL